MDTFGDREGQDVPFRIALLLVRRDGVVDDGLDTILFEVFLKFIPPFAEDRENMEDVCIPIWNLRQCNRRVGNVFQIVSCNLAADFVVLVQML